ncbi:MarR family winged helix-turn-helix transcriptional regulator [Aestuariicoccus sp. MJ-SS9]|uniref:MarR family winged helix-turn-helix transcriptional regulator n=1 Tax=Aestuariicoccus sp. MJ-SS9 TaxID=3079855 RepID=UPI0029141E9B|nr:MarR family transcriptional regulator [Aestuariicoccus sp. MJ-SS9]MDU8910847.1 MarR family transcriptional regulator [Aestuariicoccus sp. MJ-SS9]
MTLDNDNATSLERFLCFDLYAAHQAFGRVYKPLLDPLGLTYPQYLVMTTLWAQSPLSVGQIGRRVGLETNTLTPLLKRMEQAGLIQRRRARDDERRVVVTLTDAGRDMQARAAHVPACVGRATGLDTRELQDLQDRLRRLTSALNGG